MFSAVGTTSYSLEAHAGMTQEHEEPDPHLDKVLLDFLRRHDLGETVDRQQFLNEHPEYAEQLQSLLEAADWIEKMAGPTLSHFGGDDPPSSTLATPDPNSPSLPTTRTQPLWICSSARHLLELVMATKRPWFQGVMRRTLASRSSPRSITRRPRCHVVSASTCWSELSVEVGWGWFTSPIKCSFIGRSRSK